MKKVKKVNVTVKTVKKMHLHQRYSKNTGCTAEGKTVKKMRLHGGKMLKKMHLKAAGGTKRIQKVQTMCRNCGNRVIYNCGWVTSAYASHGYETSYFCSQDCLAHWFGEEITDYSFFEDLPLDIRRQGAK